jgi:hypothetical protein
MSLLWEYLELHPWLVTISFTFESGWDYTIGEVRWQFTPPKMALLILDVMLENA